MKLDADWIVGFTDADGCFSVCANRNTIRYEFILSQDVRSKHVLFAVKSFFGVGNVHKAGGNMWAYSVSDVKALNSIIVPFFDTHPLRTSKHISWLKFRESLSCGCGTQNNTNTGTVCCFDTVLVSDKHCCSSKTTTLLSEHKTDLNAKINSKKQKDLCCCTRSRITPSWLVGFIDGDGCFTVSIVRSVGPRPQFILGLKASDKGVAERIQAFLGCGTVYQRKNGFIIYQISAHKDLRLRLFPLLYTRGHSHLLRTQKRHSVSLFRRIVESMEEQLHLTEQGLAQIRAWKTRMHSVSSRR
jgi:hypothetical protein